MAAVLHLHACCGVEAHVAGAGVILAAHRPRCNPRQRRLAAAAAAAAAKACRQRCEPRLYVSAPSSCIQGPTYQGPQQQGWPGQGGMTRKDPVRRPHRVKWGFYRVHVALHASQTRRLPSCAAGWLRRLCVQTPSRLTAASCQHPSNALNASCAARPPCTRTFKLRAAMDRVVGQQRRGGRRATMGTAPRESLPRAGSTLPRIHCLLNTHACFGAGGSSGRPEAAAGGGEGAGAGMELPTLQCGAVALSAWAQAAQAMHAAMHRRVQRGCQLRRAHAQLLARCCGVTQQHAAG